MKKAPGTLRRVLRLLRPYRAYVAGSILLAAVFVAASLYVPILVGNAIDCIVAPGQVDFAAVAACGAKIAAVAAACGGDCSRCPGCQ